MKSRSEGTAIASPRALLCAAARRRRPAGRGGARSKGLEVIAPLQEERALLRHELAIGGFLIPFRAACVEDRPGIDLIAEQPLRRESACARGSAMRIQHGVVAHILPLPDDAREKAWGEVPGDAQVVNVRGEEPRTGDVELLVIVHQVDLEVSTGLEVERRIDGQKIAL